MMKIVNMLSAFYANFNAVISHLCTVDGTYLKITMHRKSSLCFNLLNTSILYKSKTNNILL